MNPWPFVLAAYAITVAGGSALVVGSLVAMRRAERRVDALRSDDR